VESIGRRTDEHWKTYHIKDTEKGPVVWRACCRRLLPWHNGQPADQCRLIIARNVPDGQTKYFLSNAPSNTPVELLLHVAFSRSEIEELFERSKGQIGLDHFQMYQYKPLRRHMILSMLSLTFLSEQTQRLRGGKSAMDASPGSSSHRGPTRQRDARVRTGPPTPKSPVQDPVLAGGESTRPNVASQEQNPATPSARHRTEPVDHMQSLFVAL
jgi:hypothetical protein